MSPEEALIWSRIQQKDGSVFESYYLEHYSRFFLMACKYLHDAGLAEEIVNDVFVKLWQDGQQLRIESSLRSYIYRAVINRSLDVLDKKRKERETRKELSQRPEETEESRQIETNELEIRLYKAIDELPEQCGKVFRMSRFEELKQQEIADRLGISIKTVKNHITYALRRLNSVVDDTHVVWIFFAALGLWLLYAVI